MSEAQIVSKGGSQFSQLQKSLRQRVLSAWGRRKTLGRLAASLFLRRSRRCWSWHKYKAHVFSYRVSHSSRPNFVCIYLGLMRILPNILLTMLSARLGNFFEVWNTMVHARMPQKNAEWIFGWFSILVIFLPNFEDFKPILATLDKLQGNEMKNLISIVE